MPSVSDHKVTLRRILHGAEYRLSGKINDDVSAFEIGGTLRKRQ